MLRARPAPAGAPSARTPPCRGGGEAHELDPANWTYKRQAWTLVTTPPDATENDLIQGPNDVYAGNWLDDVVAAGGGANYYVRPRPVTPHPQCWRGVTRPAS